MSDHTSSQFDAEMELIRSGVLSMGGLVETQLRRAIDSLGEKEVTNLRDGVFYPTRFASPQGTLIPLTPQESLIVYRPKPTVRLVQRAAPGQQLWLFELVQTA